MQSGRIPETIYKRSILKHKIHRRKEVTRTFHIGAEYAAWENEAKQISLSTAKQMPLSHSFSVQETVYHAINELVAAGGEAIGIMPSLILPEKTEEPELKLIFQVMETICETLEIEILGESIQVSRAVSCPFLTITAVGNALSHTLANPKKVTAGQEIVMTKWAAISGTRLLLEKKEQELLSRYPKEFLQPVEKWVEFYSVLPEAKILRKQNASYLHNIGETGIFGALWDMAEALQCGVRVSLKKIPVRQQTIEICDFFDINPYMADSKGTILCITDHANNILEQLHKNNIPACVIGKITGNNDRIIENKEEIRYLEPPRGYEMNKLLMESGYL